MKSISRSGNFIPKLYRIKFSDPNMTIVLNKMNKQTPRISLQKSNLTISHFSLAEKINYVFPEIFKLLFCVSLFKVVSYS